MNRSLLFIVFLSAALSTGWSVAATPPVVPIEDLRPLPEHRRATRLITHVISNYHYKNVVLDDALSRDVLERYIEALDPIRSYLIQQDIDEFNRHADRVDDYLRSSSLDPLFEIFVRFRQRLGERVEFAVQTESFG